METAVEIKVEAKEVNELLRTKRCSRHEAKTGKKAKRSRQKQQWKKELRDE